MAHVPVPDGMPGIRGLMAYRPEHARPLNALADALLHGPSPLTKAERETIATTVSHLNGCRFCAGVHGAVARVHWGEPETLRAVLADPETAPIPERMKALLAIAARVQAGGTRVTKADISRARAAGATDVEVHDAVLVAAAFCMFNRYVDGLATDAPDDEALYDGIGAYRAVHGYAAPTPPLTGR